MIADRFVLPDYQEVSEETNTSQITVARIRNKIRDDWMSAEQQLKLAVMDSVGDTIRHIIAPPPMAFQSMTISDIIKRVKEILTKKLDNGEQLAYTLR